MVHALWAGVGYLLGSVPFGVLITRAFTDVDVRAQGSGNIGATNVARTAGRAWGALVLALDALKGVAAVALVQWGEPRELWLHALVALSAVAGHVAPVWLGFKGGKGVATALGVLTVLSPWSAAAGFAAWAVIVAVLKLSSLGSLVGGVLGVAAAFLTGRPLPYALTTVALLAVILFTHRGNLSRLAKGRELKA